MFRSVWKHASVATKVTKNGVVICTLWCLAMLVPEFQAAQVLGHNALHCSRVVCSTCPHNAAKCRAHQSRHLCWCMGPVLWLWPRMQSTAQSSKCSSLRLFKGVKRLERVNCWTSESCARKPCPRNSAPIEDVATPWPHYSLSPWWFCCKIQTLWDLWPDEIQTWNLSVTQSMNRMIRPQNANAFPASCTHHQRQRCIWRPARWHTEQCLQCLQCVCGRKGKKRLKETQGETWEKRQKLTRLFHLGSECCTGWRWWRNNMLRPFIKFILSHQKILEALQLIFTAKTAA